MRRSTYHFLATLPAALAILGLWWAATAAAAEPTEDELRFIGAARETHEELAGLATPVQRRGKVLREQVDLMLGQYDEIHALGPCPKRDELVLLYEGDRPSAIADQENLATAIRALEPAIKRACDFVDRHPQYWGKFDVLKKINSLTLDAGLAIEKARRIPRPPPLPYPLPGEARPSVDITDVRMENPESKPGEQNQYIVTLQSSRRYSSETVVVEVQLREGQATIEPPLRKSVTVEPQQSATLTWTWWAKDSNKVKIGSRIVR